MSYMKMLVFTALVGTFCFACGDGPDQSHPDADTSDAPDTDSNDDPDVDIDEFDADINDEPDADSEGSEEDTDIEDTGQDVDFEGDTPEDADGGCGFSWTHDSVDPFADEVVDFSPAEGATFGSDRFPEIVLGPPLGGGAGAGSLDVLSLGCGGSITLSFDGLLITDGPGPDFIVFENPFGSGDAVFAEPAQVSVSADGKEFVSFPCDPETLVGCAGQEPVLSNPDNCIDPTDPDVAGGDAFDLDDVGLSEAALVRIEDRSAENSSSAGWCGGGSSGFDLDAVAIVHVL